MPALDAIHLKLARAKRHVEEVEREIAAFLSEGPGAALTDHDPQAAEAFRRFHEGRAVPISLSILSGEAIHQMRSSLDHLLCALILADHGEVTRDSKFPILGRPPTDGDLGGYLRQVRGIARPEVRGIIEDVQPYKRTPEAPGRNWLLALRDLSAADRHRLLIIETTLVYPRITATPQAEGDVTVHSRPRDGTFDPTNDPLYEEVGAKIVDVTRSLEAKVSFEGAGRPPIRYPVGDGLNVFLMGVWKIVERLAPYLR